MAWQITGTYYAPCSCKVGCPCLLGEMEGDRDDGSCSGVVLVDVRSGESDGVDLGGTRAALVADWPKGFLAGNGTGRIYINEEASEEQQRELEAVVSGQKGGVFEVVGQLVTNVLETRRAPMEVESGNGKTRIRVGDVGEAVVEPLRGPQGDPTRLLHGAAAFREETTLARGTGTRFRDPDLSAWESQGHGEFAEFDWSA